MLAMNWNPARMGPHAAHLVMAIHAPVFRDSEEPTVNTVSEHDKIYAWPSRHSLHCSLLLNSPYVKNDFNFMGFFLYMRYRYWWMSDLKPMPKWRTVREHTWKLWMQMQIWIYRKKLRYGYAINHRRNISCRLQYLSYAFIIQISELTLR